MSTISSMNLGIQGIHKGMEGLRRNAADIASAKNTVSAEKPASLNDIAGAMVDMNQNKLQVEMSAKVVQTASDMIGTLLDVKA